MSRQLSTRIVVSLWIAVVGACSLFTVSQAEASSWNKVPLKAERHAKVWQTKQPLSAYRALEFVIYVNGKDISGRGTVTSRCTYILRTPKLTVSLRNCGTSRLTVRYSGAKRFTFAWRQEEIR